MVSGSRMQDKTTRKKAVNLSIDTRLADEAKAAGLNLSALLESALADALRKHRAAQWLAENKTALASVDAYIEKHGLPLDKFRSW